MHTTSRLSISFKSNLLVAPIAKHGQVKMNMNSFGALHQCRSKGGTPTKLTPCLFNKMESKHGFNFKKVVLHTNPTLISKATKSMFMTVCPHYNCTKHFSFEQQTILLILIQYLQLQSMVPIATPLTTTTPLIATFIID
jgi:hypothetical protein